MLVGGVVYHKVHDNADSSLMCRRQHSVEILHGTKILHNPAVIADVISIVVIGRFINRRKPYYINSQFFQVIHFLCDTVEISDPVSVAVVKTSWINLIYYGFFPPCSFHIAKAPFCF